MSLYEWGIVQRTAVLLLNGKRLEVRGKAGLIIYLGRATVNRSNPFWYEHPGGRTYKETPEEIIRAVIPHVGFAAIEKAIIHPPYKEEKTIG